MKTALLILLLFFSGITANAQTELIVNGAFSTLNSAWQKSGNFQYDSRFTNYHSPTAYAYLADFAGQPGNNISGLLYQDFAIPASAISLTVSLWYRITTDETTTTSINDFCSVILADLNNSNNNILIARFSNLDKNASYSLFTLNVTIPEPNHTWRLIFSGVTNSSLPTVFRFDDVSVITNSSNTNCITWYNNMPPSATVDSAMQVLCSYGIINSYQNASSITSHITKLEVAGYLTKALLGNADLSFLDNFPCIYPNVNTLSINDQHAVKLMLFLEYKDKGFPPSGDLDNVSPFARDNFYIDYGEITKSDAIKALLETWDLAPSMIHYLPGGSGNSPMICDMQVSNKNLGWVERAQVLGYLTNNITTPCSPQGVSFGQDGPINYAEFYVMLARQLQNSRPSVGYSDFFTPNIFYTNNLNRVYGTERGIFHEYANSGFSIPSGGIPLTFQYSYHSNLTEIPILDEDNDSYEQEYLKPKLQPLGGGWTHSYSAFIKVLDQNGYPPNKILIYWPDGSIHSFLVPQNTYETKGITDKLFIDSVNTYGHPAKVRIQRGRIIYYFQNIDNPGYRVLSLVKITDAHGNSLILEYKLGVGTDNHQPMLLSKVTDNFSNRSLLLNYSPGTNYLLSVTDPINRSLTFYPNPYTHDLDSAKDAKSQVTKYLYYYSGGDIAYRTHLLTWIQRPKGNFVNNSYYAGKLTKTQTAQYVTTISPMQPGYENPWQQQKVNVSTVQNNQTLSSTHIFDTNGNISSIMSQSDSVQITYDTQSRPLVIRNLRSGFIKKYEYDVNGFLSKDVLVDSLFNDSTKVEYANNTYGEVLSIKDYNDQSLHETKIYRNSDGDPTSVVENEGLGGQVQYTYGYQNGLLSYVHPPLNDFYNIFYNSYGNPTTISHCTQSYNCISATNDYDVISRVTATTDYDGKKTSTEYDASDNVISITKDPSGLHLQTQYSYDANDNLVSVVSPKGHTTILSYDFGSDALIEENDGTNRKHWSYNQDGSLDTFVNKNNTVFKQLYYDESLFPNTPFKGYLFSDGTNFYQYEDVTKELKRVNNTLGKANLINYDNRHRGKWDMPGLVNSSGFFTGATPDFVYYEYDRMRRPSVIAYPAFGGKTYNFSSYYDYTTKNLWFVQDNLNFDRYVTYDYQKDGKPVTEIYGNGDTIFHHYDGLDRQDSIWAKNKYNQLLYSIGVSLDNTGKHTRENLRLFYNGQEVTTLPSLPAGETKTYSYELRNRIQNGDGKSYTSNGAGDITTSTNPPISYTWSDKGQLLSFNRNGVNTTYEYDPLGNRRRKDNTYYVVDQQNTGNVVIEATQNTTPISAYVYGNGLVARIDPASDSVFYYHYDMRGSVIAITNQNGQMVQYYKYDPFGAVYDKAGSITWNNSFQYLGRHGVQTDDYDLYYMKARYYQPSTGRFISEDPKWNTNLFTYSEDDPVNNIDPQGTFSMTAEVGIGESLIPIWGNFRQAMYYANKGNYLLAVLNTGLAISDIFGVGEGIKAINVAKIAAKESPQYLYHYTTEIAAKNISKTGLQTEYSADGFIYLTDKANLSPLQAQIELALPANKPLPNSILRINISELNPTIIRRVQGNLPGMGAGGGIEFLFNQNIPAKFIEIIK